MRRADSADKKSRSEEQNQKICYDWTGLGDEVATVKEVNVEKKILEKEEEEKKKSWMRDQRWWLR